MAKTGSPGPTGSVSEKSGEFEEESFVFEADFERLIWITARVLNRDEG